MTKVLGGRDFWLAALRQESATFRHAVAGAELTSTVPSCPGWTVADLITHLGGEYGWVRGHIARGVVTAPDPTRPAPPAGADLPGWFDEQTTALLTLLDELDPDLPAYNWAPQGKTAGFWFRRLAHDTAVHRWDAQFATITAEPVETKQALDGIAEVLDTFLPAGRGRCADDLTGVIGLVATDAGHEFFVRQRGDGGIALLDTGTLLDDEPTERVVAAGTASDILLVLWGRADIDVLQVTGDERLVECLRVG